MSGRSRRRCLPFALLALAAVAAACNHPPGDSATTGAPPPLLTAVGPIPGPNHNPPRRQNPYGGNSGAAAEGRHLFVQMNCSGCHGGHAGGGMGPSLRDVDWIYGNTSDQIYSSVAEGRAHGMPAWGYYLPEDQIWKLVAYVETLRTTMEPEPPQ